MEDRCFACNMLKVSMSSAERDRKVRFPTGFKAQIEIPVRGSLTALVVPKGRKGTAFHFPHTEKGAQQLPASFSGALHLHPA